MPPKRTQTSCTRSNACAGAGSIPPPPAAFYRVKIPTPSETQEMSDAAHYAVRDGIAVISMNNPPVNGLSDALRAGVLEHLEKADKDAAVKAVILIGAAKSFSGGADIREFNKPRNKPRSRTSRKRWPGSSSKKSALIFLL
jgi:hypothetical protein